MMDSYRVISFENVPVYLPSHLDGSMDYLAESLINTLLHGNSYSCTELADQSYQVQETIWSALLSFINFKQKSANGAKFRVIYLCSGFQTLSLHMRLLHQLKERMKVEEFEENVISTAFSEPCTMSSNRVIRGRFKDTSLETNLACRAAVRSGICVKRRNFYDDAVPKPELPNFFTDFEGITGRLHRAHVCFYYTMLSRMERANLIVTTYDALKGTLSGQRMPQEKLLLDKDTYLICEDAFAMEKAFEECYDFTLGIPSLQRTMSLIFERKRQLMEMQENLIPEPLGTKEFYALLRFVCQVLDKICCILKGEIHLSPEKGENRLHLLAAIGLQQIDPKSLHNVFNLIMMDLIIFSTRFRQYQRSLLIEDVNNIHQFFRNLMNPDVSEWMFSSSESNLPFRFWLDKPDEISTEGLDVGKLNFKFFGVTVNPVFAALRRRRVPLVLALGTMIPVSFASINPKIGFRARRLYNEEHLPILSRHLFSGIFALGPGDVCFNGHIDHRTHQRYILAMGQTIHQILQVTLGKVLILFPSVAYHKRCLALWLADGTLGEFEEQLHTAHSCGSVCEACTRQMGYWQKYGTCVAAFARSSTLEGICGGFDAVVAVQLPYLYLEAPKVLAKKAYLSDFKSAAFDFYTQEAVNALVSPFFKATCLDPLSVHRGRIFIVLDTRFHRQLRFLPTTLNQVMKEFTTFNEGISRLKEFLRRIPVWNISTGPGDVIDPAVYSHILQMHKNFLPKYLPKSYCRIKSSSLRQQGDHAFCGEQRMSIPYKVLEKIEQFRADENIDLLAAGLLDAIRLPDLMRHNEFDSHFFPWIMNFRRYFRNSEQQGYWPIVMGNLFKQILERPPTNEYFDVFIDTELPD